MKFPLHPFTVDGSIRQCWLFVYRLPVETAQGLPPSPLRVMTRGGYAFMNIVVCRLRGMRPAPFPAALGLGYWHVAYRWHVWAKSPAGQMLEGLHFLRSECDRWLVEWSGNLLTDFHFHRADIRVTETAEEVTGSIASPKAPAHFRIDRRVAPVLSDGSPFASLEEAAAFLKYRPFSLAAESVDTLRVVRVRREESAWRSRVVTVANAEWRFLEGQQAQLELCYAVEPIDYRWERGRSVRVMACA